MPDRLPVSLEERHVPEEVPRVDPEVRHPPRGQEDDGREHDAPVTRHVSDTDSESATFCLRTRGTRKGMQAVRSQYTGTPGTIASR